MLSKIHKDRLLRRVTWAHGLTVFNVCHQLFAWNLHCPLLIIFVSNDYAYCHVPTRILDLGHHQLDYYIDYLHHPMTRPQAAPVRHQSYDASFTF